MSKKLVSLEIFLQLPRSQQQQLMRAQEMLRQIEREKVRKEKARKKRLGVKDE